MTTLPAPKNSSLDQVMTILEAARQIGPVRYALDEDLMELRAEEWRLIEALLPEVATHFEDLPLPRKTYEKSWYKVKKNWMGRAKTEVETRKQEYVALVLHDGNKSGVIMDRTGRLYSLFPYESHDVREHPTIYKDKVPVVAPDPSQYTVGYSANAVQVPFEMEHCDRLGIDTHQILTALGSSLPIR